VIAPEARRPRANFAQGEGFRYRVALRRVGRAAYQGHLDLVRLVPRVFRRAELDMFYSQGFHPKPEMNFGPALALGVASLDEYVDVKLTVDVDPARLPAMLQPGAPDGLTFTAATRLGPADPSLSKLVDETGFVLVVPWPWLRDQGIDGPAALAAHVAARAEGGLVVMRRHEGIGKRVDVSSYLLALEANAGVEAVEAAGYAGELATVRFVTRVLPSGAVRPTEVAEALFSAEAPVRFVRTHMGKTASEGCVSPMHLEAVRAAMPAPPPRAPKAPKGARTESAAEECPPAAE
jgi:radical SAM-linked protein